MLKGGGIVKMIYAHYTKTFKLSLDLYNMT